MSNGRDDFPKAVRDALGKRASFICSNPDCRKHTVAPSEVSETDFIYIGKVAHITAASIGGPRYDERLSSDERRSASNGIFLCSGCADKIDYNNGLDYSVATLRRWKTEHDKWVSDNLNKGQPVNQHAQTFHVQSIGQQGGITAGIVYTAPPPRKLADNTKAELIQLFVDKTRLLEIIALAGNAEAYRFALQIRQHFIDQGYQVSFAEGMGGIVRPLRVDPVSYKIFVGGI